MTEFSMKYRIGQRVVTADVGQPGAMPGYYGRVVNTLYDLCDGVEVDVQGRTDGEEVEPWVRERPIIFFCDELEHAD